MEKIKIGVDYYPERWGEAMWESDAVRMKEAGIKVIRMAEFAWCKMEPEEGRFELDWLVKAVNLFGSYGIQTILCTPTNCAPLWLYEKYPEILQVQRDGKRTYPGVRSHRCYNSSIYRLFVERIIRKMSRVFAGNPYVAAWQIDNEVDAAFCCCDVCAEKFRGWLKEKYGTLDEINRVFGNEVWSGSYSSWTQIQPPLGDRSLVQYNPAYLLDFQRFASDGVVEYVRFQANLLRETFPDLPITTNTWYCDYMPDFYDLFEELDICSYDNYPSFEISEEGYSSHAFHLDMMRGVKRRNFWIMEQLGGAIGGCWMPMGKTPRPGVLKGMALQAIAHGADQVLHFRWRSSTTGAEMYWHGILDQNNIPGRKYRELQDLCRTIEKQKGLEETTILSKVAILCSFDSEYAWKLQTQAEGFYYLEQLQALHAAFTGYGLNVDIIHEEAPLDEYEIVAAPAVYVRNRKTARQLHKFVEKGGMVILTARSGVKDENNNCIMEAMPAGYREMTGCQVEEYDGIGHETNTVIMDGIAYPVTQWCEILQVDRAETIAVYGGEFYAGAPAVTRNRYGAGSVYYIGTVGKPSFYEALAKKMLGEKKMRFTTELPARVEMTVRENDEKQFVFLFNNDKKEKRFVLEGTTIELQPFEMKIQEKIKIK